MRQPHETLPDRTHLSQTHTQFILYLELRIVPRGGGANVGGNGLNISWPATLRNLINPTENPPIYARANPCFKT